MIKLTKSKLRKIIKEEIQILNENQKAANLLKKFNFSCSIKINGSDERTIRKIFNPKVIHKRLGFGKMADWTLIDVTFPYGDPAFIDKQVKKANGELVEITPQFTVG